MGKALAELFWHNLWANQRLIDFCAALSDAQLDAQAPGAYGPARDTLVHLCAAEERYVSRLTGETQENPLRESAGFPGFEELRERSRHSGEALVAIAEKFQPTRVLRGTYRDEPYSIRAIVLIIQAINHATEHRANIITSLAAQGIEPPEIDGWAYGDEMGSKGREG